MKTKIISFCVENAVAILSLIVAVTALIRTDVHEVKNRKLTEETQPIVYTISTKENDKYYYSISCNDKTISIPSKSAEITIQSGDIKSISAITFFNNKVETLGTFNFYSEKERLNEEKLTVSIDVQPLPTPLLKDTYLYDYFFIYIESLNGEKKLDLICYEIDLGTKKITNTYHYTQLDLISLNSDITIKNQLLTTYKELITKINSVNNLLP